MDVSGDMRSQFFAVKTKRGIMSKSNLSLERPRDLYKRRQWLSVERTATFQDRVREITQRMVSIIHLFLSSVTELTWLSKTFVHVLLVLFYVRLGIDTLAIARDVEICDIFTIMLQYFNDIHFLVFSLSVHHNLTRNCLYFLCTQNIKKSSNCMQTSMIFAYQWRSQRCLQRNLIKVFKEI